MSMSASARFNIEIALRAAAHRGKRQITRALQPGRPNGPTDIFLCVVDHFEPQIGRPSVSVARERLEDWLSRYPRLAARHQDADGIHPAHSFFYPWDEYDASEMTALSQMCRQGWGEIEVHLHHRDDTADTLRRKLQEAVTTYRRHGALSQWPDGRPAWGFIHGNWALDNSRCENGHNFCGVNNELTVLAQEGCFADFTFPAWQHMAQPRQINSIYYATDTPQPKSYDRGVAVRVGGSPSGTLLLIHGPLTPMLEKGGRGRWRVGMDDGDLAFYRRYSPARLDRWVQAGVQVAGRPDRVFVKLHCHGAADKNRAVLLGKDLNALFADAALRYNDGKRFRLHHVTAREMFNVVQYTEADMGEDLLTARNYLLPPPVAAPAVREAATLRPRPSPALVA